MHREKKLMGRKGVVLTTIRVDHDFSLVASKEAVFVFFSVATQRVFARYFFLNTTRRRKAEGGRSAARYGIGSHSVDCPFHVRC